MYSSSYTDMSNTEGSVLGTLECLTQNSPPTTVTWLRDGVAVNVDGVGYEMMQIVTERQSYSRYKNVLLIRNAAELAGNHTYTCSVSNAAGSNSQRISTTLTSKHVGNGVYMYYTLQSCMVVQYIFLLQSSLQWKLVYQEKLSISLPST